MHHFYRIIAGLAAIWLVGLAVSEWLSMETNALTKIAIAHRGASAYLPEHTLEAYALAYGMGADYIEPDVVMTKDDVFICLHDLYLETTTNAAERFPDKRSEDGHYYAADFTLAEIKQLRVYGRATAEERSRMPRYEIPTLEEMILMIQALNRRLGREVGIVPEMKQPDFHRKQGKSVEQPLLAMLAKYGYDKSHSKAIIQCFDDEFLRRLRHEHKTELPLVFLTAEPISDSRLHELAGYVNGIGANRLLIEDVRGQPSSDNAFVKKCHEKGLKVFVWTMKAEEETMRRFYHQYGVDGIFCDYPDLAVKARQP